ncbi:type I polyketide synthase [Paenibacillus tuaregi]|uniref:type I polyketide synthase n=1 Tax=Paenibacillus tuaregi TaxID=1816681 RepID=UPI000838FF6F|nr:type I polyketide synthase [Paenibacillus tuaregi]
MSNDIDFSDKKTDIAIIGVSIRLPSVRNVEQFWDFIKNGEEVLSDVSGLNKESLKGNSGNRRQFIQTNSNIKGIEYFDNSFFNINASEASWMDPQHRLFLELAWEALESAGYADSGRRDITGVYAGVYANYYSMFHLLPHLNNAQAAMNLQIQIASEKDHVATMTAYKLGLTGPTLNIQSACSSSLTAVHMACESLLTYSSDMMVCGAATLSIPQLAGYEYQDNGLLSSDGHLRAFDASATGTIYSDGAGCVVLKRFTEAWEDGDTIYGVIKGSAINNDGSQKAGFAAPSVNGQIEVIERAMMVAGVRPEQISYLEAHGTGTPMGDSMELEALHEVFGKSTSESAFCSLGSAKSNFGHTGPAAGVIGLIKTVMALKEKILPPAINIEIPNDRLATGSSPFYLNPIPLEWNANSSRYAGVSSFGLGGTNVHVIVEEPPKAISSAPVRKSMLYVVSAKTPEALRRHKDEIQTALNSASDKRLADAAYTLQTGRKVFEHRGFFIASTNDRLSNLKETKFYTNKSKDVVPNLQFNFPDLTEEMGSNDIRRVREDPQFHEDWTEVEKRVSQALQTEFVLVDAAAWDDIQAALSTFILQIVISRMWRRMGISPSFYEGRGAGLYAAAAESGWLKLEDAAYLYVCYVQARRLKVTDQEAWVDRYHGRSAKLNAGFPPGSLVRTADNPREDQSQVDWGERFGSELLLQFLDDSPQTIISNEQSSEIVKLVVGPSPSISGGDIPETSQVNETAAEDIWDRINYCLGWLWMEGYFINWPAYYGQEKRLRIPLPTYPFERVRCWVEPELDREYNAAAKPAAEQVPSVPLKLSEDELIGYKAPRNGTERVLVHIWEKHLGVTPIGIQDNFYELGGNSLLAASLNANVNEIFNVDIGLEVFLGHQSIEELAEVIESFFMESIPLKGG